MNESRSEQPSTIFIVRFSDTGLWHAVWSNDTGFLADYDSDNETDMLAWARERSDEIWLWSAEQQDYVRLGDQDGPPGAHPG